MIFVIRKNKDGFYWWRAVGNNGEIMAASELLSSKQACEHAISVIKAQASAASIQDRTDEISVRGAV